jgi:mycoredoxin
VPAQLTMYTTVWCGFCKNLKRQLAQEGIEVAEVDIELDPEAAEYVMSVNGGNQTVPTVLFPDGSAMVNPSAAQVRERLATLVQPNGQLPATSALCGGRCLSHAKPWVKYPCVGVCPRLVLDKYVRTNCGDSHRTGE